MYKKRIYRANTKSSDLANFSIQYFESDLSISCRHEKLKPLAVKALKFYHAQISSYIESHPDFQASLSSLKLDKNAPRIVRAMFKASEKAGVGPMAAVAGAVAEFVGKSLLPASSEVIIENGGDIFLKINRPRKVGIFAGPANPYNKLALNIVPQDTPCGICASSGKFGHSLSFGRANAVVIIARSALVADAFATAIGNLIKSKNDVKAALRYVKSKKIIKGAIIIVDDVLAVWGKVNFAFLDNVTCP